MRGILTKYMEFLNTWDVSLFCQSSLRFHEFFQSCFIFRVKIQAAASNSHAPRVSVQGVKALGGHCASLCRGFEFYEEKKKKKLSLFFKKKMEILLHFLSFL